MAAFIHLPIITTKPENFTIEPWLTPSSQSSTNVTSEFIFDNQISLEHVNHIEQSNKFQEILTKYDMDYTLTQYKPIETRPYNYAVFNFAFIVPTTGKLFSLNYCVDIFDDIFNNLQIKDFNFGPECKEVMHSFRKWPTFTRRLKVYAFLNVNHISYQA